MQCGGTLGKAREAADGGAVCVWAVLAEGVRVGVCGEMGCEEVMAVGTVGAVVGQGWAAAAAHGGLVGECEEDVVAKMEMKA